MSLWCLLTLIRFKNGSFYLLKGGENVRVTLVNDSNDRRAIDLSAGNTKILVGTGKMMDAALAQHGVVLKLRLAQRRAVTRNDDKFGLSGAQSGERLLVAHLIFARLHNKRQARVDRISLGIRLLRKRKRTVSKYIAESWT